MEPTPARNFAALVIPLPVGLVHLQVQPFELWVAHAYLLLPRLTA